MKDPDGGPGEMGGLHSTARHEEDVGDPGGRRRSTYHTLPTRRWDLVLQRHLMPGALGSIVCGVGGRGVLGSLVHLGALGVSSL